ncbi:MAG: hypothetical protein EOP10_27715 [Proteobacteria bacterium]|nr:MAG: hypothetical protein EOP10_27715 [Pseudomonadota bacterium]
MSELSVEVLGGLQGDPGVYAFQKTTGEALLFDLGSIDQIQQRDLMKARHVFVSHTHMDHFMGFDRWLRVNIPHKRLLKIWGPAPFFERVQAKLRSYAWNLIEPDQLRFEVHEICEDGSVRKAMLRNSQDFAIELDSEAQTTDHLVQLADGAVVSAAQLRHVNIASIAYKVKGPDRQRFLHDNLSALNLTSGSWISELQSRVNHGPKGGDFKIGEKSFAMDELVTKLLRLETGPSLVYLTDLSFDRHNLASLKKAFQTTQKVICESSFLDADRNRAVAKAHLTTRQAALIAMSLDARELQIFHVSTIYGQGAETSLAEAKTFFEEYSQLSANDKERALEAEFLEVEKLKA